MARKQVIVQLDEDLVADLDREAASSGVSRSELIRRAARALLEALRTVEEERRHADAYRHIPQDPELTKTFHRLAAETLPEW